MLRKPRGSHELALATWGRGAANTSLTSPGELQVSLLHGQNHGSARGLGNARITSHHAAVSQDPPAGRAEAGRGQQDSGGSTDGFGRSSAGHRAVQGAL